MIDHRGRPPGKHNARDAEIRAAVAGGTKPSAVALAHGLTTARIYQIVGKHNGRVASFETTSTNNEALRKFSGG